jgi:hypothetical protein
MENHAVNKQEKTRYNVLAAPRSSLFQLLSCAGQASQKNALCLSSRHPLFMAEKKKTLSLPLERMESP